jgi:putative chitinase
MNVKPEMIANRVYANRMKNGDEYSGDGFRFRGRGLIQLTGVITIHVLQKH